MVKETELQIKQPHSTPPAAGKENETAWKAGEGRILPQWESVESRGRDVLLVANHCSAAAGTARLVLASLPLHRAFSTAGL